MTHTPGPWKVVEGKTDEQQFCLTIQAQQKDAWIAELHGYDVYRSGALLEYRFPQIQYANATLIAAAPELLAALKAAIPWIMTDDAVNAARCDAVLARVHAAIARAEGRSGKEQGT